MGSVGTISIGLRVGTQALTRGLKDARREINGFGSSLASAPAALGALGAGAAIAGLVAVVKAGSDLNETVGKTGVVFGPSAGLVLAAADEMAARFGIVKTAFLDAAADLGQVGKAAELSEKDAAELGVQFAKLGADVSSISNKDVTEVYGAIKSGLVGSAEPLRQFGVLLDEDTMRLGAARLGIARFGEELTQAQKVQARAALISEQLQYALGDLDRTSTGVANGFRSLKGRIVNFAADAGTLLQPVAQAGFVLLNAALQDFGEQLVRSSGDIRDWATEAGSAGGVVFQAWSALGTGLGVVADVLSTVRLGFLAARAGVQAFYAAGLAGLAQFVGALQGTESAWRKLAQTFDAIGKAAGVDLGLEGLAKGLDFGDLSRQIGELSKGLADGAKSEWATFLEELGKAPPSEGIADFFERVRQKAEAAIERAKALQAGATLDGGERLGSFDLRAKRQTIKDAKIELEQRKKVGETAKTAFEESLGPIDSLALKFKELEAAQKAGLIDQDVVDRIQRKDARELVRRSSNGGGAVEARSVEAFNAFVAYQVSKQDPLKSLPDLAKRGNELAERQVMLLERVGKFTGSNERSDLDAEFSN